MFKRISMLLCTFILFIATGLSASAYESHNVVDYMGFFSEEEGATLQTQIDEIATVYQLDVVIVTTDDTEGKISRDYADDFYDYGGYGLDEEFSGLLMLINMGEREVWISTTGKAISIFTDSRIESMLDSVYPYLSNDAYYDACNAFLYDVEFYGSLGAPSNQYTEKTDEPIYYDEDGEVRASYGKRIIKMLQHPIAYICPLIVAVITTFIVNLGNGGHVTVTNKTYETPGSFSLTVQDDIFAREHTTRTKITKNTGGGGGGGRSSVHIGSSGRSHGGGGRRF